MISGEELNEWRRKYASHKASAAQRGIDFLFTFPEWLDAWGEDLVRRGPGKNGYAMCRFRDRGAYEAGNVYIATNSQNGHDVKLHNRYNRPRGVRRLDEDSSHRPTPIAAGSNAMRAAPDVLADLVRKDAETAHRLERERVASQVKTRVSYGLFGPKVTRVRAMKQPHETGYSTAFAVYEAISNAVPFSLLKKPRP